MFSPERDALGRPVPPATPPAPRTVRRRRREASRHYTHTSGVSAHRAATVASAVNPPEQRPSVSAATSDRRGARPTARRGSTIRPLLENNGNRLEVACAEPLGAVLGDQTRVRQVLFNLLSNACKFTENGLMRLEARRSRRKGSDWVEFRVTDTGIGMSAEQLDGLYRPFMQADASTTRKYGGTGLGLAISREFCQMMSGSLSAESELGKGSAFTVRLPGDPAAPAVLLAANSAIAERQTVHA